MAITDHEAYRTPFLDWLACACGGADSRAAGAVRAMGGFPGPAATAAVAATAGHVLDYDDTFPDGVVHISATCAPAALVMAAHRGRPLQDALSAYAAGFEACAVVAEASHPALYDRGWHPSAVCGPVGAAVASAALLGLTGQRRAQAIALALARAGGTRGTFGSDAKAIAVGSAAAAGVQGALAAQAGAETDLDRLLHGDAGLEAVLGLRVPAAVLRGAPPDPAGPAAIGRNWIKLYPSCLGTHAPIAAATTLAASEPPRELTVAVGRTARQAAYLDDVADGLAAKFSIPYCVAYTLRHGAPGLAAFGGVEPEVRTDARGITVVVDGDLPPFAAVIKDGETEIAWCRAVPGSPEHPADERQITAKWNELTGGRLDALVADPATPAAALLEAAGLSPRSGSASAG
jgi:2-methylcitrate dehydratase PrpD